jgi:Cwf15/Cwc15 cell cycle control protein
MFGRMAAAHRPTIVPAKGHEEQGGMRIFVPSRMQSAKDMAAHTKLKFRYVWWLRSHICCRSCFCIHDGRSITLNTLPGRFVMQSGGPEHGKGAGAP